MAVKMKIKQYAVVAFAILLCGQLKAAGFNDNANGTVTDFATGLIWQQLSDAHNIQLSTHDEASTYCENLNLASNESWRLPTVKELSSLVDYQHANPSINKNMFSNTMSNRYWTASLVAGYNVMAWTVNFEDGEVKPTIRTLTSLIRCVR